MHAESAADPSYSFSPNANSHILFCLIRHCIATSHHPNTKVQKSTMYAGAQYTVGGHVRLIGRMENSEEGIDLPPGTVFKIIAVPGKDGGVCTILIPARFIPARKYMEMELAAAEEHLFSIEAVEEPIDHDVFEANGTIATIVPPEPFGEPIAPNGSIISPEQLFG
eukprot:239416_1